MAQIHGNIASLTELLSLFEKNGVTLFKSLSDIISFNSNFNKRLSDIEMDTKKSLQAERETYKQRLINLKAEYESKIAERKLLLTKEKSEIDILLNNYSNQSHNFLMRLQNNFKIQKLNKRKAALSTDFEAEVGRPLWDTYKYINDLEKYINYIESNFDTILKDRIASNSIILHTAKRIIDENVQTLLGAVGEHKVQEEIRKFPDSFVLINDFSYVFTRALHRRNPDDWIKTIQVDHLLISLSGIFVIETKNWSNKSTQSLDLYSPIQQVQRQSYAVFVLVNRIIPENNQFPGHHWGRMRIPVHNIVLMINNKPRQEFQYVKVLTLAELYNYMSKMKPIFNEDQVYEIANILLKYDLTPN